MVIATPAYNARFVFCVSLRKLMTLWKWS